MQIIGSIFISKIQNGALTLAIIFPPVTLIGGALKLQPQIMLNLEFKPSFTFHILTAKGWFQNYLVFHWIGKYKTWFWGIKYRQDKWNKAMNRVLKGSFCECNWLELKFSFFLIVCVEKYSRFCSCFSVRMIKKVI